MRLCAYCGNDKNLTIDHIIPISIGGSNSPANKQTLCYDCNNKKGNKITPKDQETIRIRQLYPYNLHAIPDDYIKGTCY